MGVTYGKWHGLSIEREDATDPESQLIYDVMHPEACSWSIAWHSPWHSADEERPQGFYARQHDCDLAYEMREWGNETGLLPTEPGLYWVRLEHTVYPSSPAGPKEYDLGSEWVSAHRPTFVPITRPALLVEPGESKDID